MTIAGCFVTGEGVVLGADSTTSFGDRYFDHAQKLLQIDEEGCFGIVTWGWAGEVGTFSYRTNVARFADHLVSNPVKTTEEAAQAWSTFFWDALNERFKDQLQKTRALKKRWDAHQLLPDDKKKTNKDALSSDEEKELNNASIYTGFCLAGRAVPDREINAFTIEMEPVTMTSAPKPSPVPFGRPCFWGAPGLLNRLRFSIDDDVVKAILAAEDPKTKAKLWNGTQQDLVDICLKHELAVQPQMPIRDAIDLIHSSISMTGKWLRFAQLPPICGGAVEVGVITTDRPYRWVRHKSFDAAI